jgi:outer membrane lipoprotein SlyB
MSTSIYALANNDTQANTIVKALQSAGFRGDDISVLFPDKSSSRDFAHEKNTKAPEGAVAGGVSGGVLGGALGWMAGIGLLAIPGIGPFVAAGPILALLSGAAIGAAAGGLTGSLIGMGMPEFEAKRYEGKIREGRILISVHADNGDWTAKAKQVLKDAGAEDISSASEATAKVPADKTPSMKTTFIAKN